jgi:hypothetical protein
LAHKDPKVAGKPHAKEHAMKYIEPRASDMAALRFFERRRLGNLWGLLRRRSRSVQDVTRRGCLPFLELAWLPYFMVPIRVVSKGGPGEITVSVEAYSGAFAVFEMHDNLVEGRFDGDVFPPKLEESEAVQLARTGLLKAIMRRRGQRHKPVIDEVLDVRVFYYPYWVYYFERRRNRIDFKIMDALTGEKGGARTKTGLLGAFVEAGGESPAAMAKTGRPD